MMQKYNRKEEYITKAAYCRLFIPELDVSKGLKKVIYLDVDIIVKKDIKLLHDQNLEGNIVGVVNDYCVSNPIIKDRHRLKNFKAFNISNDRYFNSGMLLIDVNKWKKEHITEKSMQTALDIMNIQYMCHDQSILNIVLNGKAKMLPCKYNTTLHNFDNKNNVNRKIDVKSLSKVFDDAVIIHYSSQRHKPWLDKECLFAKEFWKIIQYTDFEEELKKRYDINLSIKKATKEKGTKLIVRYIFIVKCILISGVFVIIDECFNFSTHEKKEDIVLDVLFCVVGN